MEEQIEFNNIDVAQNKNGNKQWCIQDFEIGRPIAKGRFGKLYLAREKKSKYIVALKLLSKKALLACPEMINQFRREIEIQGNLRHKNIIALYGYFWDDRFIYLIQEYCPGKDLFIMQQQQENRCFTDRQSSLFIKQMLDVIEYIQQKHVIHRDIKPENILYDSNFNQIKLCDFGWAIHSKNKQRTTLCGTEEYLAPEIVRKEGYDQSVDTWCLGVLTYELLVGRCPFESNENNSNSNSIKEQILYKPIEYPPNVSLLARNFIEVILNRDNAGQKRPTIEKLKSHQWIQQYDKDNLKDRFIQNSNNRLQQIQEKQKVLQKQKQDDIICIR